MLEAVTFVLRHQEDPGALKDLAHTISSFLRPPPDLPLSRACSRGSTKLLDWIWDSSCPSAADRPSNWALANFLRSDSHYNRYQFSKSVEVAATRNDLVTLKWLFAHFAGCQVPKEVAAAAATHGNVPMLQFLWENDAGRLDRGESTSYKRQEMEGSVGTTDELIYSGNVVDWGRLAIRPHNCADIARWIRRHLVCHVGERDRENAIIRALQSGDEELAKALIPSGRCVLDYAARCSCVEMVELLLDCGYIRRDRELANRMIQKMAGAGRLDLMQQIVLLHSPLPEGESFCYEAWYNAMVAASWTGRMATLKWLVGHPMGQPICYFMKSRRNLFSFVCIAGNQDQLEVMQYLYDLGAVTEVSEPHVIDVSERCLVAAIRRGCYKTVKWFIDRVPFPSQGVAATSAVTTAAICGRINILRLFLRNGFGRFNT